MAQKTTRIEARLTPQERAQIERAAALAGESVSTFLIGAAVARAEAVFENTSTTVVPADYFDELLATIDQPDPAPRLQEAVRRARRSGRIDLS
jgi:uncharacterized protein (DUF1778 family)